MTWNLALTAIALVFIVATLLSVLGTSSKKVRSDHPIESYLLAGASLRRTSVISLLFFVVIWTERIFLSGLVGFYSWRVGIGRTGRMGS